MIRVAVDAMGGDNAPAAPVAAAALAQQSLPDDIVVQLVGQQSVVEAEMARQGVTAGQRLVVVDAPEVIGMGEKPLQALRAKKQSSIAVGLSLQKGGQSDAFISAGNTGACMAASTLILRLFPGFERPAIGTPFPTAGQVVLVLDGGANVDCSAPELLGFARLGVQYVRDIYGRPDPVVGLLNVGEEAEKGNAAAKEAHALLAHSGLKFVGNIEGRDIVRGRCDRGPFDVVVCDGFVGNVLLKFYESMAYLFQKMIEQELGAETAGRAMKGLMKKLDYAEYGGAPLLGVMGVSIISHGRSSAAAIKAGIGVAAEAVRHDLVRHTAREFQVEAAAQ